MMFHPPRISPDVEAERLAQRDGLREEKHRGDTWISTALGG